jgi:hypothetical protein
VSMILTLVTSETWNSKIWITYLPVVARKFFLTTQLLFSLGWCALGGTGTTGSGFRVDTLFGNFDRFDNFLVRDQPVHDDDGFN